LAAWVLFPGNIAYVWHGALHAATVAASLIRQGFTIRAQIIWAKERHLAAANRVSPLDRGVLAVYCVAYAAWLDATITIQTYGSIMKSPNGHPMQSPAVSIANQQADIIVRTATQFGFTPASRIRLPRSSKETPSWLADIPTLEDLGADLKPLVLD
jgi:P27 family predicted phage terminase small subunit